MKFMKRFYEVLDAQKGNYGWQRELSRRAGINQDTLSKIISRSTKSPGIESVSAIVDALGVEAFFGMPANFPQEIPELALVPLVKARQRAGTGGLETDGEYVALYAFKAEFLQRKGGSENTMRLFKIEGTSMEPTLTDGSMVLVNTGESARHIVSSKIYLLRIGDELMIKRLETRPGCIAVLSDNPNSPEFTVDRETRDFEIFGRVVWACREY